ncbi:regucalcin-like isoform X1 [Haliotis rufescens]|uniref:regucalcin-like isoform X1 n=2 Tax=Haliotis rufescens TaxID=6454 RepID=UPI00201F5EAF|nr:regucalcin-like isoform X1 [Haliotis rufescens]
MSEKRNSVISVNCHNKIMSEKIEVVLKNCTQHGEGPHWDDTTQCLYYVDYFVDVAHRYNPATGQDSRLNLGDSVVSVIIPRQKGGFVVSQKTDLGLVDSWESGKVTSIAKVEADANMLNDGKVDASGRLWIGSEFCGKDIPDLNKWPKHQGSLYSLDSDGSVTKHISNISIGNGMDWNEDNSIMYFVDSIPRQVWAFDFDITAGAISNKRIVTDFSRFSDIPDLAVPDGMAIDTEGKLWVAAYEGGKVLRIDPTTGNVIRTVKFPCEKITSLCFGGKDFTDLYVTSSSLTLTPTELSKTPLDGSLFKVTGLGVRGYKANMFSG